MLLQKSANWYKVASQKKNALIDTILRTRFQKEFLYSRYCEMKNVNHINKIVISVKITNTVVDEFYKYVFLFQVLQCLLILMCHVCHFQLFSQYHLQFSMCSSCYLLYMYYYILLHLIMQVAQFCNNKWNVHNVASIAHCVKCCKVMEMSCFFLFGPYFLLLRPFSAELAV